LTGALAEQLYVARRRRVTRREHRLIVRELRGLIADAVERAAVRPQDALDARVRPLRNLLHLFERLAWLEGAKRFERAVRAAAAKTVGLRRDAGAAAHRVTLAYPGVLEPVAVPRR